MYARKSLSLSCALLAAPALLGLGCADKESTEDTGPADAGTEDAGSEDTGSDGGSESETSDEDLIRDAIDGLLDPQEALDAVAQSGGLPVQTSTGSYLIACMCGDGTWSLAGDHDGWAGQELTRAGDLAWIEVEIDTPDGSLYKFFQGDTWIADPLGRRYGYDENGEHSLIQASAAHLERWYGVEGEGLVARDLQVWVPDGGVFTHTLYAHDGQNLFDPYAIWGGWRLQDALPAGVLVVGIDNTADRMEEYTHTTDHLYGDLYGGDGAAYAALVQDTIRPLIEHAYGTAGVTGTMGSSLGGLISLYLAHLYPGEYDMVISMSGTVSWGSFEDTNPTIIELYQDAGHRDTAIYVDSGGSGTCWDGDGDGIEDDDPEDSDNYCVNQQLKGTLDDIGYTFDVDLWHWHEPDAEHNEWEWASRVWRPLEIFASR